MIDSSPLIQERVGDIFESPPHSILIHGLLGTCQLIPPFPFASKPGTKIPKTTVEQEQKRFWIACLFTSSGYGKNTDPSDKILENTKSAMRDLKTQIEKHKGNKEKGEGEEEMGDVYSVRINSGLFGVDWGRTKEVLEEVGVPMVVMAREEDQPAEARKDDQPTEVKKSGKKRTAMDEFVSRGKRARVKS
ncbi:MAG: hypothetical protein Q9167_002441 [Letrouitia subvulpina]